MSHKRAQLGNSRATPTSSAEAMVLDRESAQSEYAGVSSNSTSICGGEDLDYISVPAEEEGLPSDSKLASLDLPNNNECKGLHEFSHAKNEIVKKRFKDLLPEEKRAYLAEKKRQSNKRILSTEEGRKKRNEAKKSVNKRYYEKVVADHERHDALKERLAGNQRTRRAHNRPSQPKPLPKRSREPHPI